VIEEIPQAASSTLGALASCTEANSERDVHRLTAKFNLALPIPLSKTKVGTQEIEFLKFSDWAQWLLSMNLWGILCGLSSPNEDECCKRWSSFWSLYRDLDPSHEVFTLSDSDLGRTCGLLLHGDEGRSLAKTAIMIVAVHSILGFGLASARRKRSKKCFSGMHLNYKCPTWCTRFLLGVMPKSYYSDDCGDQDSFQDLMRAISLNLRTLFEEGLRGPDGKQYRFCVLRCMGDWPFIAKAGQLARSFMNVSRASSSTSAAKGICHRCQADQGNILWEDFESVTPEWVRTIDSDSPFIKIPEVLRLVPDPQHQPRFFSWDWFHGWNLGAGKHFVASAIVVLAMSAAFEGSIESRLSAVNDSFREWCTTNNIKPRLRKITKDKLSWPSTTCYPQGSWSKGATTTYLLKWLVFAYSSVREKLVGDNLAGLTHQAIDCINQFLLGIYSWEVWIPKDEGKILARVGLKFLKLHGRAAMEAYNANRALYLAMPNLHRLHHIFFDMLWQSSSPQSRCCLNPLTVSTQADEDFIGRPSRLSRRVSPRATVVRTIQRSLQAARSSYVKAGILRNEV